MDEDEAYTTGTFNTYEEALKRAKEIVERSLRASYKPGMKVEEWLTHYKRFGDDTVIIGSIEHQSSGFSAWSYAEKVAAKYARNVSNNKPSINLSHLRSKHIC